MGETHTSESGRTVRVARPSVQKSIANDYGFPTTFIAGAEGQFVKVDVHLSAPSPRPEGLEWGLFPPAGDATRESAYSLGHPEPEPPPFEPTLALMIDGSRYEPSKSQYWGDFGIVAFDVPAEPVANGSVVWTDPEQTVHWELPERVRSEIPRSPDFELHALSGACTDDGVRVDVEVENASAWPGTYRALFYPKRRGQMTHSEQLFEDNVPGKSTRTFRISNHSRDCRFEGVTMVFDDGFDSTTVRIGESANSPTS